MSRIAFAIFLAVAGTFVPRLSAQENSAGAQTIIVLDASGSMWGQIDGVAKIDIAKEVIADLLKTLDPKLELGLMAYGHRRKGDCADIELMIPPGKVDRAKFLEVVQSISPKGKTPLTDSVEAAAKFLQYETKPGSVILVSDGIENCDRDPCALAKILKEKGIDFKAHVVAFDLTEKDAKTIKCLADETGGQFLPAQDAGTLKDALQIAVKEVIELAAKPGKAIEPGEAKPPEMPVEKLEPATLKAPATVVAGSRFMVGWDGPDNRGDRIGIVVGGAPDEASGYFAYSFRGNPLQLVAPVEPGPCELRYRTASGKVLGRAAIEVVEALATIKAPAEVPAGTKVKVTWTGPDNKGDAIVFALVGAPANQNSSSRYAPVGKTEIMIHAPVDPGDYEARYITARTPKILASQPVKVVPAPATLSAPETVMAGSPFEVRWTGPAEQGNLIAVAKKGAPKTLTGAYAYPRGDTVSIDAPIEPGPHEVRYLGRGSKILASFDVTVTDAIATVRAPSSAMAGSPIEVNWTGPDGKGDFIVVCEPGAPGKFSTGYNYTNKGSPVLVNVPTTAGSGEVRYVSGRSKTILKRQPIEITAATATLKAPATAKLGTRVTVEWTGPGNRRDRMVLVAKGTDKILTQQAITQGKPASVRLAKTAGDYEIRYLSSAKQVLAKHSLKVD